MIAKPTKSFSEGLKSLKKSKISKDSFAISYALHFLIAFFCANGKVMFSVKKSD